MELFKNIYHSIKNWYICIHIILCLNQKFQKITLYNLAGFFFIHATFLLLVSLWELFFFGTAYNEASLFCLIILVLLFFELNCVCKKKLRKRVLI